MTASKYKNVRLNNLRTETSYNSDTRPFIVSEILLKTV